MDNIVIKSVLVDTISSIFNGELVEQQVKSGKLRQDDWNDYGSDVSHFIMKLKSLGFTIVIVIGHEARGKSYAMKKLAPKSFMWFNSDNKLPTFKYNEKDPEEAATQTAFNKWYGTVNAPGALMRVKTEATPMTFMSMLAQIGTIKKKVVTKTLTVELDPNPVVFLIGHIQVEKGPEGELINKLRLPGKVASTKYAVEGLADLLFVAEIITENGKPVRKFRIQSFGHDNARCPEGMFEDENGNELVYIPNDYQLVVDAIDSYYNFPKPQAPVQTELDAPGQIPAISTSPTPTPKPQTSK